MNWKQILTWSAVVLLGLLAFNALRGGNLSGAIK